MRLIHIVAFSLLYFCHSQVVVAEEALQKERFQKIDESIVLDSQTGLMWALQDNGEEVDWYGAEKYCEEFDAGGHTDWRLPDIKELATLFTKGKKNKDGYFIAAPFKVSDCCMWSSDTSMEGASIFSYKSGKKPFGYMQDKYQLRALPVRGTEKPEPKKQKL